MASSKDRTVETEGFAFHRRSNPFLQSSLRLFSTDSGGKREAQENDGDRKTKLEREGRLAPAGGTDEGCWQTARR